MLLNRNNTHSKMFLILFLCILASGSLGAAINTGCESNSDCPKDSYCYTVTHECAPCSPNFCKRFHRKDSLWKKCPTEPEDCDLCLPGYEEEVFSDGSKRGPCILSHQPTTSQAITHPTTIEVSSSTFLSSTFVLPLLLVLAIFGVAYHKFRFPVSNSKIPESLGTELQPQRNQCNHGDSPVSNNVYSQASAPMLPPGYHRNEIPDSEETELQPMSNQCNHGDAAVSNNIYPHTSAPLLPPEYSRNDPYNLTKDTEVTFPHYYERRIEVKPISLVQAGVFRKPDYEEEQLDNADSVLDQEGEEEELESLEAEEESNQRERRTIPPLHYHDETTRPSEWTPGPIQNEENTSLPPVSENGKRPSTEMASSEGDDEQNTKRICNNQNEEENEEACSSSVIPPMYRNFATALSSIRQNSNTGNNSAQNKSTNSYSNLKDN